MDEIINIDDLIHISSEEGSYAWYYYFYYQGYYLVIEETIFEKENFPIYIYFNSIPNSIPNNKEVRVKFQKTNKFESQYLVDFLNQPDIKRKYINKHPRVEFINIEKKLIRMKKINKLLNDIS